MSVKYCLKDNRNEEGRIDISEYLTPEQMCEAERLWDKAVRAAKKNHAAEIRRAKANSMPPIVHFVIKSLLIFITIAVVGSMFE